jgi:hypothetical protein
MTKGEDSTSRALMIPFLAIHAKGGESMSLKQKGTAPPPISKNFVFPRILSFGILLCSKGGESSISKRIYQNPLEPLTICKRTLKRIYKRICKNKTCGASVVQNIK